MSSIFPITGLLMIRSLGSRISFWPLDWDHPTGDLESWSPGVLESKDSVDLGDPGLDPTTPLPPHHPPGFGWPKLPLLWGGDPRPSWRLFLTPNPA